MITKLARYVLLIGLAGLVTAELVRALARPNDDAAAIPQIYLKFCPDSVSGSGDDVGISVEQCVDDPADLLCRDCLRAKAQADFHAQIDALYECKKCVAPETGCDPTITSDGFDAADCEYFPFLGSPIQIDCDDDGELEWWQAMHCATNSMDWMFSCSRCNE